MDPGYPISNGGILMADKIKMTTPLVEMDGDEMTQASSGR